MRIEKFLAFTPPCPPRYQCGRYIFLEPMLKPVKPVTSNDKDKDKENE